MNIEYNNLTDEQKRKLITKHYTNAKQSFPEIAEQYGTYPNKLRRDAIKFGIRTRNLSEAQKTAMSSGRNKHPTKDKKHTAETKAKMGLSHYKSRKSESKEKRKQRSENGKKQWRSMSDIEKSNLQQSANQAIRNTSKTGSKLEKYLLRKLIESGYKPEFHKEQILSNTKLQIDIFVTDANTAIEVDGPSHFKAVWGNESLQRNQKYDQNKNGLIIGKGMRLIRIKQLNDYSDTRAKLIFDKLNNLLQGIKNNTVAGSQKILYIED
jgi:very-short-patch-repair endonuclease